MNAKRGIISIQALWILTILSFLVMGLALRTQMSMRMDHRVIQNIKTEFMAVSYAKLIDLALENSDSISCSYRSECLDILWPVQITIGQDSFKIEQYISQNDLRPAKFIVDEESKVNINTAPDFILSNIITNPVILSTLSHKQSSKGNDAQLKDEHSSANRIVRSVDELALYGSISRQELSQYRNRFTVYGNGQINLNSTNEDVLISTGCPASLIQKILSIRQLGIISSTDAVIADLIQLGIEVNSSEANYLKDMQNYGLLGTKSEYYSYSLQCTLSNSDIDCNLKKVVKRSPGKPVKQLQCTIW